METVETLIYLLLGLPLLAAANTLLFARFENLRDGQAVLLGLVTAGCAYALYTSPPSALETVTLVTLAPQLTLAFTPEPLGMLFALVAGSLWPLASLYTIGYMRGAGEKTTRASCSFTPLPFTRRWRLRCRAIC